MTRIFLYLKPLAMKKNNTLGSVYQSSSWYEAHQEHAHLIRHKDVWMYYFEQSRKIPILGTKKVLFTQGDYIANNETEAITLLSEFRKKSKKYFYGLIQSVLVDDKDAIYKKAGFYCVTNYSLLIDLQKTKEELWKDLEKKSARWGVKTAEKNNLSFNVSKNQEEIDAFYTLYQQTCAQGGFFCEPRAVIDALVQSEIATFFLVKHQQEIVAGAILLLDHHFNYTILDLSTVSEQGQHLQAMPFLYWNLILYSKEQGFDYLDLGGYDKEAKKGSKLYLVNQFKERFGGKLTQQRIYTPSLTYVLLRKLLSLVKKFRS